MPQSDGDGTGPVPAQREKLQGLAATNPAKWAEEQSHDLLAAVI